MDPPGRAVRAHELHDERAVHLPEAGDLGDKVEVEITDIGVLSNTIKDEII